MTATTPRHHSHVGGLDAVSSEGTSFGARSRAGPVLATAADEFARELNERVIRRLFAATIDLIDLAGSMDDPARVREMVGCVERIDTVITHIRAAAFGTTANGRSRAGGQPT